MTIREKQHRDKVIDLTGPHGNAFVLLGLANQLAKQLGPETLMLLHGVTAKEIQKEMMAGNYKHLIETFDKYFGDYVTLER